MIPVLCSCLQSISALLSKAYCWWQNWQRLQGVLLCLILHCLPVFPGGLEAEGKPDRGVYNWGERWQKSTSRGGSGLAVGSFTRNPRGNLFHEEVFTIIWKHLSRYFSHGDKEDCGLNTGQWDWCRSVQWQHQCEPKGQMLWPIH